MPKDIIVDILVERLEENQINMGKKIKVAVYQTSVGRIKVGKNKWKALNDFHQGIKNAGDESIEISNSHSINPDADVHVVLGYLPSQKYQSHHISNGPHIKLKHDLINYCYPNRKGKFVLFIDSCLFNPWDSGDDYLRYSLNGVFPNTGYYGEHERLEDRYKILREKYNVPVYEWRTPHDEQHILLCLQRREGWSLKGKDPVDWAIKKIHEIRKHTDRKILVRPHPKRTQDISLLKSKLRAENVHYVTGKITNRGKMQMKTSLLDDLKNAWCSVHYNSGSSTASVIAGVPIFIDDSDCFAGPVANRKISKIENPELPDRTEWLLDIVQKHWNAKEIKKGIMWKNFRTYIKKRLK